MAGGDLDVSPVDASVERAEVRALPAADEGVRCGA
jgi:hypothetical protein